MLDRRMVGLETRVGNQWAGKGGGGNGQADVGVTGYRRWGIPDAPVGGLEV